MKKNLKSSKKILIITLDGGTLDLIQPLVELGYMPTIKRLLETGSSGILNSTIPPVSAPAWASFMTGKNPGKHGVFSFRTYEPGTNGDYFVNSQSIRAKTIWEILSEKGKKVVVINLPMTYPPYPVNGIMISGFDTPSLKSQFTYPEQLKQEILSLYPDFELVPDMSALHDFNQFIIWNSMMMKNLTGMALHFMKKTPWDIFMINFQNTDWIQHLLWENLTKELNGKPFESKNNNAINLYKEIDMHVRSLIDMAGEDKTVKMVFSDHGFGPYVGEIYINQFFIDWNLLSVSMTGPGRLTGLQGLKRILRRYPSLYNVLKRVRKKTLIRNEVANGHYRNPVEKHRNIELHNILPVRWSKTKACATIMKGIYGFIYINLKGRQPHGIVSPGEEYETLRNQIIEKLKIISDQTDGSRLFENIYKPEDIYPAYDPKITPDIIAIPKSGYTVSLCLPSDKDKYTEVDDHKQQQGTHYNEGFIIVHDREVFKTGIPISANIIDILPTVLYLLGLPIPKDIDGRVLTEIMNYSAAPAYEERHPPLFRKNDRIHTTDESIEIQKRLRAFGYID